MEIEISYALLECKRLATKRQIERAVRFYAKWLQIDTCDIDLHVCVALNNYCAKFNGFYGITLAYEFDDPWEQNLAHEMVHLRQFLKNGLRFKDETILFRKKEYLCAEVGSEEYYSMPHEIEAYELEEIMYNAYKGK